MSEVSISNQAVTKVGGNIITSLTDDQKEAKLCNAYYAPLRDAVLEASNWTFAVKRFKPNLAPTSPLFGFSSKFLIGNDVLRIINVFRGSDTGNAYGGSGIKWQKEENYIVSNEAVIFYTAIVRIKDTSRFSKLFEQALVALLAAELAIPIAKSGKLQDRMMELYKDKIDLAVASDGRQGSKEKFSANELTGARRTLGGRFLGPEV